MDTLSLTKEARIYNREKTITFFLVIDVWSDSIVVGEDAWYDLSFLKFTEIWFVTQDVVYSGECSNYT